MTAVDIRTCRAGAGIAWLRAGLRLFGRAPLLITLLVGIGPMTIWSLGLVPVIGTAVALALVPAIAAGMLTICRSVDEGAMPGIGTYALVLRDPAARLSLLRQGIVYAVVMGALATAWSFVPDAPTGASPLAALDGALVAPPPADGAAAHAEDKPAGGRVLLTLVSVAVWIPLQMAVLLAPVLAAWHGLPAGKAMFFSFFACWRNRWAMLLFLLALTGLAFLLVLAFGALVALVNAKEELARYLLLPLPLLVLAITQTSSVAMVRDVVAPRVE